MTVLSPSIEDRMNKLERSLLMGRGRWIADFNESFRKFRIRDVEFDAFIRGNTQTKGFLLSRLFSVMLNPNYAVGCFLISTDSVKHFDKKFLFKSISEIQSYMKDNEIKWSWLFIFATRGMTEIGKYVGSMTEQSVGVVLVDATSGNMIHSNSYLGRQAKKYVKI